jgi:hypothetical protein
LTRFESDLGIYVRSPCPAPSFTATFLSTLTAAGQAETLETGASHGPSTERALARGTLDPNKLGKDGFPYHAEDIGRFGLDSTIAWNAKLPGRSGASSFVQPGPVPISFLDVPRNRL